MDVPIDVLEQRLDAGVDRSGGPDACWPWTKSSINGFGTTEAQQRGYGQTGGVIDGKSWRMLTHRAAFAVFTRAAIPRGRCVLHRCDNPICCNPTHLFLGDRAINCADKVAKGRQRSGVTLGEKHKHHKMTEDDVREMRTLYAAGLASQNDLSRRFGITQSTVWNILHHRTWAHVS